MGAPRLEIRYVAIRVKEGDCRVAAAVKGDDLFYVLDGKFKSSVDALLEAKKLNENELKYRESR